MRFLQIGVLLMLPFQYVTAQTTPAKQNDWQQDVRYVIEATLDTTEKHLAGYMKIFYRNNSPDSIRSFFLQVPANAYTDKENTAVKEMERFNRGNMRFSESRGYKVTIRSLQFLSIGTRTSFPIQAFDFSDTVLDLPLPVALAPGDSLTVGLNFVRDYTRRFEQRRSGDSSRIHFDFVNWFPRVSVYSTGGWHVEPFHFMMESSDVMSAFAEMTVTVSVPGHFRVAGSGEVVHGDPGWQAVLADTAMADSLAMAWHDSLKKQAFELAKTSGKHTVTFTVPRAQNFIWSASPNLIYYRKPGELPIHLLARGSHNRSWEKETIDRVDTVLAHVESYFGDYPFEQLTIVESRNGLEAQPGFVLLSEAGDFSLSIALTKMFVPGMLAIDGVQQSWFSKGLAVYLAKQASERRYGKHGYPKSEAQADMNWLEKRYPLPSLDQAFRNFSLLYMESGQNEAISQKINKYSDPVSAAFNLYLKSEIFFEMLAYVIGTETLQKSMRELTRVHRYSAISETELQRVCEKIHGQPLDWFFEQWLRGTPTIDYAKGKVRQFQKDDKTWVTEVEVERKGDGIMPVDVAIEAENGETIVQRWDGKATRGTVVFETPLKPRGVKLDPDNRVMDSNMLNNGGRRFEIHPDLPLLKLLHMPSDAYLVLWRPHLGYNHIDGVRLGLGARGSYRSFYNNLSAEINIGLNSAEVDGKISYNHPLRRGNLFNRYHLMARKIEGRFELDASLSFSGADGVLTSNSRSFRFGVNYSGIFNDAYTERTVSSDTGRVVFQEWDDVEVALAYAEGHWRRGSDKLDFKTDVRLESGWPSRGDSFAKISGSSRVVYGLGPLSLRVRGNAGTAFGAHRLPLQDQFRAEGASPRARFRNDLVRTGGDFLTVRRRLVEGGANLRGYLGQPFAVEKYASANVELGPSRRLLGLRWFGFYDAGRLWPVTGGDAIFRANAGIGAAFLGGLGQFFGGNLPIFEGISARLYLPLWLGEPLPGEKNSRFRWYFAIGKQL